MSRSLWIGCAVLVLAAAGSAGATDQKIGSWTVSTTKDPFDDSAQVAAYDVGDGGTLVVRCQTTPNRIVRATIVTTGFLGAGSANDVFGSDRYRREADYRFDDKAAQKTGWFYSDQSAFPVAPETNIFLLYATNAHKLVVRLFDFRNNATVISFNLDGADGVIRSIYRECGQDF